MSSAKRERPTVLRWDDVVELVRRGNVAPPRRVTFPFPQKGRPAGAHADVGAGQSANLVSHTSAAKLLGDNVNWRGDGHTWCLYAKTMRRKPGLRLVGGREMSKEINNDHPFASTAVDDGYHSQHRLKEATMTATRIRRRWLAAFIVACICAFAAVTLAQSADPSSEQGALIAPIEKIPPGYRDWRLISVAHEAGDLNDLRAILGNDEAIKAYREGKLPFPEGTIIARIAWRHVPSEENNKAFGRAQSFVPGDAPPWYLQFMIKDPKKYAATGGWGYAQFDKDGKPGPEADLKKCFPCHQAIKDRDFVFTRYAP